MTDRLNVEKAHQGRKVASVSKGRKKLTDTACFKGGLRGKREGERSIDASPGAFGNLAACAR